MLRFSFPTSGAETGSLKLTCVGLAINNEGNCGDNESLFSSVVLKHCCFDSSYAGNSCWSLKYNAE